ncbi:MAG TPA: NADH-quinone oxidoreductase subunit L [Candidatus Limnocylindrales bacterium]|nr:NADH-quinone oxidoreductase subunit L [Candidatus Limnocylindrales bacterium]
MNALPWTILFLPLLACVLITLFTHHDRKLSAGLSIAAVVSGFVLSVAFIGATHWQPSRESAVTWLELGEFHVDFGLHFDPLSLLMLLLVTGVASVIHIYSWGYMHDDPGFSRFFACLSLFTFSMLGIVLANNLVELFIFWELVGVSSYLLIGFWFERPQAADAGKKAFLTNRLGDFGFLLGILTVWSALGSLNFSVLEQKMLANSQGLGAAATVAGLLIFCGAIGKSAQFPLHVWLPDAMEGPTPVSALIHAATMVAAGVYMLCRVFFLLNAPTLTFISWVGGFTALLSALMAVQQDDIKRILAYSTLSQLGFMVMGVGLAGPGASMFHLTTHAFFKALLFLGAGSVIIALHHEQNIWKMGGLRKRMPVTFWTFICGTLAIAGIVPLSGFYSKDAILAIAVEHKAYAHFALGILVATLTSFYMFRLVFVVFGAQERSDSAAHAKESPPVMIFPLRILAVLSFVGGFIGAENILAKQFEPAGEPHELTLLQQLIAPFVQAPWAAACGLLAAMAGAAVAYQFYARASEDPLPEKLGALARWMRDRFYFDELYEATFIKWHDRLAGVADWFDRWIIAGVVVRGSHGTTELMGRTLRLFQTGNLQTYAFLFVLGVAFLLYFVLK